MAFETSDTPSGLNVSYRTIYNHLTPSGSLELIQIIEIFHKHEIRSFAWDW